MLRLDKAKYLSFLLRSVLSVTLSNSLRRRDVLLFLEFINIVFVFTICFIKFTTLMYIFLVILWYKNYMIFLISFSKFSDVLTAFTSARAINNLWSICLGVNTFRLEWSETLSEKPVPLIFIKNIFLSEALRILPLPSQKDYIKF